MEDNNQPINNTEQLEKNLKEKIAAASKNREQKRTNNINTNKKLEPKKIPTKLNFNQLLIILLGITTVLIFITIYLFNNNGNSSNVTLNKNTKEQSLFKKLYNSKNYDTFNCYSFEAGKISFPIQQCKQKLDSFLLKNKNANRFEIVPIISKDDGKIFESIKKNLFYENKKMRKKIEEYLFIGLSTERILESIWYIKKTLGENTIVTSSQYFVKSDNNNRGVIIRAYH